MTGMRNSTPRVCDPELVHASLPQGSSSWGLSHKAAALGTKCRGRLLGEGADVVMVLSV